MVRKVLCLASLLVLLTAVSANASLITLSLETSDATEITAVGQTVTLTLYANLPSATDSMQTFAYAFTSVEAGATMGDLAGCTLVNLTLGATTGSAAQYDSNTDAEWGGTDDYDQDSNWVINTAADYSTGSKLALSTIVWTCTDLTLDGGSIEIGVKSFAPDGMTIDTVVVDGVTYNNMIGEVIDTSMYSYSGVTLTTVPEPSTLVLLGLAAMGLLVYRRK